MSEVFAAGRNHALKSAESARGQNPVVCVLILADSHALLACRLAAWSLPRRTSGAVQQGCSEKLHCLVQKMAVETLVVSGTSSVLTRAYQAHSSTAQAPDGLPVSVLCGHGQGV